MICVRFLFCFVCFSPAAVPFLFACRALYVVLSIFFPILSSYLAFIFLYPFQKDCMTKESWHVHKPFVLITSCNKEKVLKFFSPFYVFAVTFVKSCVLDHGHSSKLMTLRSVCCFTKGCSIIFSAAMFLLL